jgi:hypothetical protein
VAISARNIEIHGKFQFLIRKLGGKRHPTPRSTGPAGSVVFLHDDHAKSLSGNDNSSTAERSTSARRTRGPSASGWLNNCFVRFNIGWRLTFEVTEGLGLAD